uniref:RNA helicase n=1 Tax=Dromaius novaehollandiae TaxID=8790 RepID=A0A8C4JC36_DRONO
GGLADPGIPRAPGSPRSGGRWGHLGAVAGGSKPGGLCPPPPAWAGGLGEPGRLGMRDRRGDGVQGYGRHSRGQRGECRFGAAVTASAVLAPCPRAPHRGVAAQVTVCPREPQLPGSAQLRQYQVRCGTEEDKFLLLCALLKLTLLRGRALLFVGTLARCYRLKLFLEQFGIAACALNSELPARSRCHVITQFNRGIYDYIVATDEEVPAVPPARPRGKKGKDPEYGVARGIDFQNVAAVINFDVPPTVESYIHRVGRTARADNPGTALTFVLPEEQERLAEIEDALAGASGESMLQPYRFCMEEIEGLRYRCRDAMRSVTKQAVKEARLREIKEELLNSEKLKTYFEDNPRDLHVLRHDKPLHPAIVKPHLRNVPDYLGTSRGGLPDVPSVPVTLLFSPRLQARGTANPLQSFKYARHPPRLPRTVPAGPGGTAAASQTPQDGVSPCRGRAQ